MNFLPPLHNMTLRVFVFCLFFFVFLLRLLCCDAFAGRRYKACMDTCYAETWRQAVGCCLASRRKPWTVGGAWPNSHPHPPTPTPQTSVPRACSSLPAVECAEHGTGSVYRVHPTETIGRFSKEAWRNLTMDAYEQDVEVECWSPCC